MKIMKKKAFSRTLLGAPLGIFISFVITLIISFAVGDGNYYPIVPELTKDFGTEVNAVLVQSLCSMIIGAAFGGASVIWETDNWSLLRQTATHLCIASVSMFPAAYLLRWMEHSIKGVIIYFAIFFAIYLVMWIAMYLPTRKRVLELNNAVKNMEENKNI